MMTKTRAPKAPPIYRAENARRIMAGHLSNFYAELIDVDECVRNLFELSEHAAQGGDIECANMASHLAIEVENGQQPALIFPTLPIDAVFGPEAAEALEAEAELLELAMTAPENAREVRAIAEAELEREHGEADRGERGESTGEANRGMRDAPVEEGEDAPRAPRRKRTTPKRSGPGQCRGKTKKGERCKANAVEGSKYCRAHEDQG